MGQSMEETERHKEPQQSRGRAHKVLMVGALLFVVVVVVLVVTLIFTTNSKAEKPKETPLLRQSASLQFRLYGMSGFNNTAFFEETCGTFYATRLEQLDNVECKIASRRRLQGSLRYIIVPVIITGQSTTRLDLLGTVQFIANEYGPELVESLQRNEEFVDLEAVQAVETMFLEPTRSPTTTSPLSLQPTSAPSATTELPVPNNQTTQSSNTPITFNATEFPINQTDKPSSAPMNSSLTSAPTLGSASLNHTGSSTVNTVDPLNATAPPVSLPIRFPLDKQEVDSACSRAAIAQDEGAMCTNVCVPQFFQCCNPFDNDTNSSLLVGIDPGDNHSQCNFAMDLHGCTSYAKCHALTGQFDPAPANLNDVCSLDRIQKDPQACQQLCTKLECCFSTGPDNCSAKNLGICLDYAPCQNLRTLQQQNTTDPILLLPTAPATLDFDCFWQQPSCLEACEVAIECCNDPASSGCFQFNFLSCLTYASCRQGGVDATLLSPSFGLVPQPPPEIVSACHADNDAPVILLANEQQTCAEICLEAACCFSSHAGENCFSNDPLGCLAWEAHCQVLLEQP